MEEQKREDVMEENMTDAEETSSKAAAQDTECCGEPEAGTETSENTEAAEGEVEETEEAAADGEKKGFFRKKKDKKDEQIEELNDRVRRQMAEFDNFRKRTEKEKAQMFEVGAKSVVEKILPVVDNFERAMAAGKDKADDPYVQGMEKIYQQLMSTLDQLDVKPIEAVGQPFDPNFHNAVMHVDDESLGENVVAAELQKGYTYRGTVVRHSMVQVAN